MREPLAGKAPTVGVDLHGHRRELQVERALDGCDARPSRGEQSVVHFPCEQRPRHLDTIRLPLHGGQERHLGTLSVIH